MRTAAKRPPIFRVFPQFRLGRSSGSLMSSTGSKRLPMSLTLPCQVFRHFKRKTASGATGPSAGRRALRRPLRARWPGGAAHDWRPLRPSGGPSRLAFPMIALSRRCRALACSLALAGLAGLALRSTPALAEGPVRFLEVGGGLYTWDGLSATLGRADGLAPGGGARGIVEAGPHTLVVLGMAGPESSKARHRREGEARLYDRSSSPPRLLHAVQFEGEPLEGLASTDLGMALILSYRPPEGPGLASRSFLHAVDLASGRLEASSEPNAPISGIAFDAGGNRVYASQKDRIQTFGIRPLVASWHLRSPGLNGPLVIVPKSGIVCAIRGSEMAIFDPALMNGRDAADRRTRSDDATAVVPLPFKPDHMALSDDGRLVLVSAPGTMVFVEPGSQAIAWPTDTVAGLQESA